MIQQNNYQDLHIISYNSTDAHKKEKDVPNNDCTNLVGTSFVGGKQVNMILFKTGRPWTETKQPLSQVASYGFTSRVRFNTRLQGHLSTRRRNNGPLSGDESSPSMVASRPSDK